MAPNTIFQQSIFEGNNVIGALPNSWNLTGSGNVTLNMSFSQKDIWLSQVVSGTGGLLVKGGSRALTLTANNSFAGGIILKDYDNKIQISHTNALGTGTFRTETTTAGSGGKLIPLADLSTGSGVANPVDIASGAYFNVFADGANHLHLSGAISSAGGIGQLYKTGSAKLTLSGINTYTGTTAVSAGILACTNVGSLGQGPVVVSDGAKLELPFIGTRQVASLKLGDALQANGTYGAIGSGATITNNTYFSGKGVLQVGTASSAPVFTANPTVMGSARESVAYTGQTLAGKATDADAGDILTYSKVSGPAWLAVAASGALSGTPPSGSVGLNSFVVRVTDSSSATANAGLQITVSGLPAPWVIGSIGSGMMAGSTSYSAGTFSQSGSGALGTTSDKLSFSYQTLTGDGEIIAKISALQDTGTLSGVGVMIRETLAANSTYAFVGMSGSNTYRLASRTTTGGTATSLSSGSGIVPNTWVKLVRSGNVIAASKSSDGATWTLVGNTTVTMATNCYIGLAVSSGSDTTLNASQFSNLSVTP